LVTRGHSTSGALHHGKISITMCYLLLESLELSLDLLIIDLHALNLCFHHIDRH
jgi:hypothetical protein